MVASTCKSFCLYSFYEYNELGAVWLWVMEIELWYELGVVPNKSFSHGIHQFWVIGDEKQQIQIAPKRFTR